MAAGMRASRDTRPFQGIVTSVTEQTAINRVAIIKRTILTRARQQGTQPRKPWPHTLRRSLSGNHRIFYLRKKRVFADVRNRIPSEQWDHWRQDGWNCEQRRTEVRNVGQHRD